MMLRDRVFDYVRTKYQNEAEHLWIRYPSYAVFRHTDNRKWYGVVMDLPCSKLGLPGSDIVDVLDLKVNDLFLMDFLLKREGFFPGYHMSRSSWISVLLDGTVDFDEICGLIDRSFMATASAGTKKALRPPKEWLVPSNPKYYDSVHAFDNTDEIRWKQGAGIKTGDIVFMYIGSPVSAILYKCVVTKTDIPWHFERDGLTIRSLMNIRLLKRYDPKRFTFSVLNREFSIFAVRGPRGVPHSLSEALKK